MSEMLYVQKRFLTDMRIDESPLWRNRTDFIGSLDPKIPELLKMKFVPLLQVLKILKCMRHYDCIITGNVRTAQLLSAIKAVFHIRTPKHIVLELMLDEEQEGVFWKIKSTLQKSVFSSVDTIFVSATSEIDTYAKRLEKPRSSIKFLPFHTNILEPEILKGDGYILSAGRTGRDYQILANAVENLDVNVVVISDKRSVEGVRFPSNVTVFLDVPYSQYMDILRRCRFVILPLKRLVKSTGQVVFLEAMAIGKPVIATETVGTKDYIRSGIDGILVPPEDPEALKAAMETLLTDPLLEKAISLNAFESVKSRYTLEHYCSAILREAEELVRQETGQEITAITVSKNSL